MLYSRIALALVLFGAYLAPINSFSFATKRIVGTIKIMPSLLSRRQLLSTKRDETFEIYKNRSLLLEKVTQKLRQRISELEQRSALESELLKVST